MDSKRGRTGLGLFEGKVRQKGIGVAGKPILVTGSIRSGTTWIGRMLAAARSVGYIWEPLNFRWGARNPGVCSAPVRRWYPYISAENGSNYEEALKNTLEFRYSLSKGLQGVQSRMDLRRLFYECSAFLGNRLRGARPLVKDPFALFSAEWLSEKFDMDVIIVIRHPAAVACSLLRLNWGVPFEHLLDQPLLLRDHLHPFEPEMQQRAEAERDIIEEAILLWRMVYSVVAKYRRRHHNWFFLRHEDIASEPLTQFPALFESLRLEFTPQAASVIQKHSIPEHPNGVAVQEAFSLRRDSRAATSSWKHELSEAVIERIRAGTSDVAAEFYSKEDWK